MRYRIAMLIVSVMLTVQLAMAQEEKPKHTAQGFGYGAIGALVHGGNSSAASQIGGGVDGTFYKGLGASVDLGYLFPTRGFSAGFGTLSPGVLYQFSESAKTVPFVTGGYTLGFREGSMNMVHFGGGVTHWFSRKIGLRIEARDHIPTQATDLHYFVVRFGISGR